MCQNWSRTAAPLAILLTLILYLTSHSTAGPTPVCSNIPIPKVPGAEVLSITGIEAYGVTNPPLPPFFTDTVTGLNICNVTIFLTHPEVNDRVLVQLFLPLSTWNGRFQATGGGGWATSFGEVQLSRAAAANYAAARTDGGHTDDFFNPSTWALLPDSSVNLGLLTNFASRSLHDMAIVGKAVTESFYGKKPAYSYWYGCSTGGREGLAEAQIYPEDFDGIVAAAPTINWPSFLMADEWPQVVMNNEGYRPTQCEFQAFLNASVVECDTLDGVADGVIADVAGCKVDPYDLVGVKVKCEKVEITISKKTADIVQKIRRGPTLANGLPLWYGLNPSTDFMGTANTVPYNGATVGAPFQVADYWIKLFLERNPDYNTSSITYQEYRKLFVQSNVQYQNVIGINNPNLSRFRAAGGKMITWQGLSDNLVFPQATLDYYRLAGKFTAGRDIKDFYRLFLAPGAGHCYSAAGPTPDDPQTSLVNWVEKGIAPEALDATLFSPGGRAVTRKICAYPLVSRYDGNGDVNSAASYGCASSFK